MTCDENKILLMDFLYNEIDPESEKLARAHLQSCAACRTEYEELSRTSLTLKAWENEDARLRLIFVQENRSWLGALKEKLFPNGAPVWGKLAWTGAGVAIGLFLIGAALNTEIAYNNGNFTYRTSLLPRQDVATTVDSQLVARIQRQAHEEYQRLLLAGQQEQREEFNRTLAKFAAEIDRQRQSDLLLVGRGLDEFQQHTNSRLQRNDAIINEFLRTVKLPQQR